MSLPSRGLARSLSSLPPPSSSSAATAAAAASTRCRSAAADSGSSVASPARRSLSTDRRYPPVYCSATRQHVGKTSTSLALLSGLQKRFDQVGFMKPVGQQSLLVDDGSDPPRVIHVDKDAVLVKKHFHLDHLRYEDMSPVLIPPGYTKDYLDGKIQSRDQQELVRKAYEAISETSQMVLCEGTGHCAVGSIVHASNAQVASWLGAKMVLVANGGLGSCFDELELNKVLCDREGVEICGVIVNKVHPEKLDQTQEYITKAIQMHWGNDYDVPLLGCIPDRPYLGCPALTDLERLFATELKTGQEHRMRHYRTQNINLIATSLSVFEETMRTSPQRTLFVCHSSRLDIIEGFVADATANLESQSALIVTGKDEWPLPPDNILDVLSDSDVAHAPPVLVVPQSTQDVIKLIHDYTPKLNFEDAGRARTAVAHYEPHIDFDKLLVRTGHAELM